MIRPIHMQMILPQTETVGIEKQVEHQKIVNANSDAANEVAKEIQHNSESVIQKDPNEFTDYKYDAREESNGTYHRPKKRKQQHHDTEEESKEDITIGVINVSTNDNKPEDNKIKEPPRVNIQI